MTAEGFGEATLGKKKAKKKSKAPVKSAEKDKQSARREVRKNYKPSTAKTKDTNQVRQNIRNLVENSAEEIANGVIGKARSGQLSAAKYLFEVAGLHPLTPEVEAKSGSLVRSFCQRIGLPERATAAGDLSTGTASGAPEEAIRARGEEDE